MPCVMMAVAVLMRCPLHLDKPRSRLAFPWLPDPPAHLDEQAVLRGAGDVAERNVTGLANLERRARVQGRQCSQQQACLLPFGCREGTRSSCSCAPPEPHMLCTLCQCMPSTRTLVPAARGRAVM